MPILSRNHKQVLAAKPIGGKRTRYQVHDVRGLLLDVFPSGKRIWYVRYEVGKGQLRRSRSFKIGDAAHVSLSTAIDQARSIMSDVDVDGGDPQLKKRLGTQNVITFDQLFENSFDQL